MTPARRAPLDAEKRKKQIGILILILGLALIGYVFGVENQEPDENDKRRDRERFERKHERWAHSRGPRLPDEERERHDAFLAQERERADARHSD